MAIKPIALSFKNNKEDYDLYKWINSHSNMSGFIKDTLRAAKEKEMNIKPNNIAKETFESGLIDMNF